MAGGRLFMVITALAGIALAVVGLRSRQTHYAAELLKLETQWIELRSEWWAVQTRAARLRAPDRIHQRMEFFAVSFEAIDGREGPEAALRPAAQYGQQ